jgi:hypothetical protein
MIIYRLKKQKAILNGADKHYSGVLTHVDNWAYKSWLHHKQTLVWKKAAKACVIAFNLFYSSRTR